MKRHNRRPGPLAALLAGVLLTGALLGGCGYVPQRIFGELTGAPPKEPETLGELAYNVNKRDGYTVYLKENGTYTPFLVLTNAYNEQKGATLLVRQYACPDPMPYKDEESYGSRASYYPKSDVDAYLNGEYAALLDPAALEAVQTTDVVVTTLASSHSGGALDETETIQRKFFLLSFFELGAKASGAVKEGQTLWYFKVNDAENRTAYLEDGTAVGYWTRTAYRLDDVHACAISFNNLIGGEPVSLPLYIRPAFCLDGGTKLLKSQEVIDGKTVYLLELSERGG